MLKSKVYYEAVVVRILYFSTLHITPKLYESLFRRDENQNCETVLSAFLKQVQWSWI